ncbi:MAG: DUF933 domain-containing protein [candidate division WOR-3 bacterium]
MRVAIIGDSLVGKSTLLKILTDGNYSRGAGYVSGIGTFVLEDPNLFFLANIFDSQKITPIHIEALDFEGFGKLWKDEKRGEIRNELTKAEALILVISDANDRDLGETFTQIEYKLLLTDLDFVSRRLEALERERTKKKVNEQELVLLRKIESWLSNEKPLYSLDLQESEKEIIKGYSLVSSLPQIFVINRKEESLSQNLPTSVIEKINERNAPYFLTCLKIEEELISMSPGEKKEILSSYGITRGIKEEISKAVVSALQITVFYTAGKTEVRAWYVPEGSTAKQAAGKIHSDMEKGFIRAEVINIEDLKSAGSEKKAKELGLYRLEGKDYIVKSGDVLLIRFSV